MRLSSTLHTLHCKLCSMYNVFNAYYMLCNTQTTPYYTIGNISVEFVVYINYIYILYINYILIIY